ncbi:MAG: phasin family protein [Hyphomicrobiales bacterium]
MMKQFENMQSFGKDGLEAYVASASAMTKGFQEIAGEMAEFSRKSFEKNTATVEKALAAKSIDKAIEVQSAAAKEAGEAYVAEITKLGEIYSNVAKEAFKPFEASVAQFTKAAASK